MEAILTYRVLLRSTAIRDARKKAHLAMHAVASDGVYALFKYNAETNIPNLYSLDAWVGITTRHSTVRWNAVVGHLVFALAVGTTLSALAVELSF